MYYVCYEYNYELQVMKGYYSIYYSSISYYHSTRIFKTVSVFYNYPARQLFDNMEAIKIILFTFSSEQFGSTSNQTD